MDHAADSVAVLRLHNINGVLGSLSGVNYHRLADLLGQMELADKPFLLGIPIRFVPIVIQADLPHRQALFQLTDFLQPVKALLVQLCGIAGMDSQRSVDKIILLHQLYGSPAGGKAGTDIHDSADSVLLHR